MPGKCAEEDIIVYLAFTPIILLVYALRLIYRSWMNLFLYQQNDNGFIEQGRIRVSVSIFRIFKHVKIETETPIQPIFIYFIFI